MNKEEIEKKKLLIQNAKNVLKTEFVGIDEIIDSLINNIQPWFLFPYLQDRPLVVNLYGMTGCGKTSLVRRLVQLLDIEEDFIYFNFAEIGEMSSGQIEGNIEEEISNNKTNRVFVYDEFQYAATLDGHGNEKDNKHGLKVFWELMDTGVVHKRIPLWDCRELYRIYHMLCELDMNHTVKLENGCWLNAEECMSRYDKYEIDKFRNYFNIDGYDTMIKHHLVTSVVNEQDEMMDSPTEKTKGKKFIFSGYGLKCISEILEKIEGDSSQFLVYEKVKNMSFDELLDYVGRIFEESKKGYDLNFKNSIIFVIGNLDEAYEMCFNTDPDMSPDQFHKRSKKISVVDIKEALQKRFRNEQIARLGNIHMIYPSFSSDTFRKIISMTLDNYSKDVFEKFGIRLETTKKLRDFIYSESVFPTQGTRPVFSSIHEIVKSKFPIIVDYAYENELVYEKVVLDYSNGNTFIKYIKEDTVVNSIKIKETLRLSNLRKTKKDEQQSLVAVHESGHFVIYTMLNDKLPEKLCSRTTSTNNNGFMMMEDEDDEVVTQSKNALEKEIRVSLAGYMAEQTIFGKNNITSGASSDLKRATTLASRMIKEYGMGAVSYFTTYCNDTRINMDGCAVKVDNEEQFNTAINEIIEKAKNDLKEAFKKKSWRNMLIESSKYLSEHSSMPKQIMKEIYERNVPENERGVYSDISYRKIVENLRIN